MTDNILKEVSKDERLRYLRESREYAQMEIDWGLQMAEKRGMKQGEKNVCNEIAKKLKTKGMASDEIAEYTGLTIKEIETI